MISSGTAAVLIAISMVFGVIMGGPIGDWFASLVADKIIGLLVRMETFWDKLEKEEKPDGKNDKKLG